MLLCAGAVLFAGFLLLFRLFCGKPSGAEVRTEDSGFAPALFFSGAEWSGDAESRGGSGCFRFDLRTGNEVMLV